MNSKNYESAPASDGLPVYVCKVFHGITAAAKPAPYFSDGDNTNEFTRSEFFSGSLERLEDHVLSFVDKLFSVHQQILPDETDNRDKWHRVAFGVIVGYMGQVTNPKVNIHVTFDLADCHEESRKRAQSVFNEYRLSMQRQNGMPELPTREDGTAIYDPQKFPWECLERPSVPIKATRYGETRVTILPFLSGHKFDSYAYHAICSFNPTSIYATKFYDGGWVEGRVTALLNDRGCIMNILMDTLTPLPAGIANGPEFMALFNPLAVTADATKEASGSNEVLADAIPEKITIKPGRSMGKSSDREFRLLWHRLDELNNYANFDIREVLAASSIKDFHPADDAFYKYLDSAESIPAESDIEKSTKKRTDDNLRGVFG